MNDKEKSEVIGHLASVLRDSLQKRLVEECDHFGAPTGETTIEYFNPVFNEDEMETLKRKFLSLIESL